jgi:hypothetical protein
LARERGACLEPDKQIAHFVGLIRLYQDDRKLRFLEGVLKFLA